MPYITSASLPAPVRHHLPMRAQDIYRKAFNAVWATHGEDPRREEVAHRIAWAAVKRQFHKGDDGQWQPGAVPTERAP
jgi:cation transport regulator